MSGDPFQNRDLGLLSLLSTIAGLVDVIGFLELGHVFTAHITGNLVLLLSGAVGAGSAPLAQLLSIPMFAVSVAGAYLVARRSGPSRGRRGLLIAHALLLLVVLTLALQRRGDPPSVVLAMAMAARLGAPAHPSLPRPSSRGRLREFPSHPPSRSGVDLHFTSSQKPGCSSLDSGRATPRRPRGR